MKGEDDIKNQFVMIPNDWYNKIEGKTFIETLGQKRFTIWYILMMKKFDYGVINGMNITIKQLKEEFPTLQGLSRASDWRKVLLDLKKVELIKCDSLDDKTKPSDMITIYIDNPECKNGYSRISTDLFKDKIDKLNTGGFFVYCLLYKYHNVSLGNNESGNYGYAEISRDTISNILGIKTINRITKYTSAIENAKGLIKVIKEEQYTTLDEFDREVYKWRPKRYIVRAKCEMENKYYIPIKK